MTTVQHARSRLILASVAVAIATTPAVFAFTASPFGPSAATVAACAPGETEDLFTDNCVPELSPSLPYRPVGAPTEQQLTACSGHDQGECTANEFYGAG
jgi:hypothetical protein